MAANNAHRGYDIPTNSADIKLIFSDVELYFDSRSLRENSAMIDLVLDKEVSAGINVALNMRNDDADSLCLIFDILLKKNNVEVVKLDTATFINLAYFAHKYGFDSITNDCKKYKLNIDNIIAILIDMTQISCFRLTRVHWLALYFTSTMIINTNKDNIIAIINAILHCPINNMLVKLIINPKVNYFKMLTSAPNLGELNYQCFTKIDNYYESVMICALWVKESPANNVYVKNIYTVAAIEKFHALYLPKFNEIADTIVDLSDKLAIINAYYNNYEHSDVIVVDQQVKRQKTSDK